MPGNGLGMIDSVSSALPLHHALLNRLDHHALGAEKLDGGFHFVPAAGEEDGHDADLVLHTGLTDVEAHARKLLAHLPDDRLLHLVARWKREPATATEGRCSHGRSF